VKVENSPSAYGFLAGLLVFLLGVVANISCAHQSPLVSRSVAERYSAAVRIGVTCLGEDGSIMSGGGSGVIVSPTVVLTAAHVADMPDALCSFSVSRYDGRERSMRVERVDHKLDLARLVLMSGQEPFVYSPVSFGPKPLIGSTVCAAPAWPSFKHKCGEVQPYAEAPGNLQMDVVIEPGNSGSGVYDGAGRLVGIVTHLTHCYNGQICGGKAATLEGHVDGL